MRLCRPACEASNMFILKHRTRIEESVLQGSESPPLTLSLHSQNSASSAREYAYHQQAAILQWTRLTISGLAIAIALAIVACTGHVLYSYNQTHLAVAWYLRLWPDDMDLRPTLGTMIPAAIVVAISLFYVVFASVPLPRSRTLHQRLVFPSASGSSFIVTLFAVIFNQSLLSVNQTESLQTWTCKFYYGASDFERAATQLAIPLKGEPLVPNGFERLCLESQAGSWMMVGLLVVEAVCLGVAVWGFVVEKQISKLREERYGGEKCESEIE